MGSVRVVMLGTRTSVTSKKRNAGSRKKPMRLGPRRSAVAGRRTKEPGGKCKTVLDGSKTMGQMSIRRLPLSFFYSFLLS